MENIKGGIPKEKLDFQLYKKGDFLSFEGPFLSHFYDSDGYDYLMLWVDNNSKYNRWLLLRAEKIEIFDYLQGINTLRKLIDDLKYEIVYFLDIDNQGDYKKIILTLKDKIPKDYLPIHDSFFEEDYADQYAKILREELDAAISEDKKVNELALEESFKNLSHKSKNSIVKRLWRNSLSSKNDILALRSTQYAVIIHNDNSKTSNFGYLIAIHNSAYTNQIDFELYFAELSRALGENSVSFDIHNVLERLVDSTISIVRSDPTKYMLGFTTWRTELLSNPNTPVSIVTRLNDFKT